jgi:hypothetical protein
MVIGCRGNKGWRKMRLRSFFSDLTYAPCLRRRWRDEEEEEEDRAHHLLVSSDEDARADLYDGRSKGATGSSSSSSSHEEEWAEKRDWRTRGEGGREVMGVFGTDEAQEERPEGGKRKSWSV